MFLQPKGRSDSNGGPDTMRAILKPRTDIGLLILCLAAGLSLFLVFGLPKLKDANSFLHTGHWGFVDFNRKLGLPLPLLVAFLQTVNESLGALLLVCGFQTQLAATLWLSALPWPLLAVGRCRKFPEFWRLVTA
jgi:uncharacterized membrane protein YphA (DoxX/SURF4 family)